MIKPNVKNPRVGNTLKMRCPECLVGAHYFETWWEPGVDNPVQGYEPGYTNFGWVRRRGCTCELNDELKEFVETIASEHMIDFEEDAMTKKGYCCPRWMETT